MDVLVEGLRTEIRLFAEAHVALDQRDARQHAEAGEKLDALDGRVTRLEATRRGKRR